jgi:Tol biopolymer transport system component
MPDGKELLIAVDEAYRLPRIMRLDLKGRDLYPVPGLGENSSSPSVRGNRLVYLQTTAYAENVWRIPGREAGSSDRQAEELIVSTRADGATAFSPDGRRIAFASTRSGVFNIWTCSRDGSDPAQLTFFKTETMAPYWSPDGKKIVFASLESGNRDIYIVDAAGGRPKQLTQDPSHDDEPSWSRDGRSIYFNSIRGGSVEIWKMPVGGGDREAVQVTHNGGYYAEESWDGHLYYTDRPYGARVVRVPLDGGPEEEILKRVRHLRSWALGPSGIYYMTLDRQARRHEYTIWYHEFETGQSRQLYCKKGPFSMFRLSVSPDEEWLLFDCGHLQEADIMLAENFR